MYMYVKRRFKKCLLYFKVLQYINGHAGKRFKEAIPRYLKYRSMQYSTSSKLELSVGSGLISRKLARGQSPT